MLVYGLISPHPPIIVPEIGGEALKKVRKTTKALEQAAAELAAAEPEELIIISPHEDHGFEVPEYYLRKELPGHTPVQEILVTQDSYQYYYDYGKDIGTQLQRGQKRYAIVASGDLSHVLKSDGPYGFNDAGPVLDKAIVAAVRGRDAQALQTINPDVLEAGAECGLRSILFLLGALEGTNAQANILSYQGPFGVGYLVATFKPQTMATSDPTLTALARQAAKHYLKTGKVMNAPKKLPASLHRKAAAFVSLHQRNGELRGCMGTIMPTRENLAQEIICAAGWAATEDPRFSPVTLPELDDLRIGVDVLGAPVPEEDLSKLEPHQYGIIVSTRDGRRGVLLPNLDGVDTVAEQIKICREKGEIGPHEPITLSKFEVEHYEE